MASGVLDTVAFAVAAFFYALALYHIVLITIGLRLTKRGRKPFDKGSLQNPVDLPRVTIIIPAKDEEVVIEGAIRCAERLQYPQDLLEILVVEDGSVDETPTIGRRMAAELPNVKCISGGVSIGKPAALNRAFAHATGDVIAIFDSDTRYDPDLLLRVAKYFHDHPDVDVAQAFPQVLNADTNRITRINAYEMRFWFQGLQAAKERLGLFLHLGGTGMFFQRRVLESLGPWDEGCLTEDLEYSVRIAKGGRIVGMLDADIWIQPTYRALHLVRQRRRWWGGALQVFWRALLGRFAIGRTARQRVDAFIYMASPIVFLVSSIMFIFSLVIAALPGILPGVLSAWSYAIVGSNLFLVALVVGEAVTTKQRKLLWLIPALYWYWFLQVIALLSVTIQLLIRPNSLTWQRTPKVKVD